MITLKASEDLNWEVITAVAYEQARFDIAPELLASVERGREIFNQLIEAGAPCYGVTTGLGKLSTTDLSTEARDAISRNILLARGSRVWGATAPARGARDDDGSIGKFSFRPRWGQRRTVSIYCCAAE